MSGTRRGQKKVRFHGERTAHGRRACMERRWGRKGGSGCITHGRRVCLVRGGVLKKKGKVSRWSSMQYLGRARDWGAGVENRKVSRSP